ncbi:AGE family epimerase/isomerase [Escherichia coli]
MEAFLIVYDVTHDKKWLDRAIRVASVIIHDVARNNHYRVTNTSIPGGIRYQITTKA